MAPDMSSSLIVLFLGRVITDVFTEVYILRFSEINYVMTVRQTAKPLVWCVC